MNVRLLGILGVGLVTGLTPGLTVGAANTSQESTSTVTVANEELKSVQLESVPEITFEPGSVQAVSQQAVKLNYRQIRSASNDSRGHLVVTDFRPQKQQAADPWQVNAQLKDVMCTNRQYEILNIAYLLRLTGHSEVAQVTTASSPVWRQPKDSQRIYHRNVAEAALMIPTQVTAHAGTYHAAVVWTLVNSLGQEASA